jgi:predicted nucleic acid-binding protein
MEGAKKIVIDASVAAKWFVKEELYEKALEVRNDYERGTIDIVAPQLLIYEVANALRYSPELEANDVINSVISLIGMQLDLRVMDERWAEETVKAAYNYGLSVYDSCYYALAKVLKVKILTADKKLFEKIQRPEILLLMEYSPSAI